MSICKVIKNSVTQINTGYLLYVPGWLGLSFGICKLSVPWDITYTHK